MKTSTDFTLLLSLVAFAVGSSLALNSCSDNASDNGSDQTSAEQSGTTANAIEPKVLDNPSALDLKIYLKRDNLALHIETTTKPIVIRDAYLAELDEAKGQLRIPRGYGDLQLAVSEIARLEVTSGKPRPIMEHWHIPGSSRPPKSYTVEALKRGDIGMGWTTLDDARSLMDSPKPEDLQVQVKLSPALDREGLLACGVFSVSAQRNERSMEASEKMTDLESLRGLPINVMNLYGATELRDCSALEGQSRLRTLSIDAPGLALDFPSLVESKELSWLSLGLTVKNPDALEGLTELRHLKINGTGEGKVLKLPSLPALKDLHLHEGQYADISAVTQTPKVESLWLPASVTDLGPLKSLPKLEKLRIHGHGGDYSPLAELPALKELTVADGQPDLTKFVALRLKSLRVRDVTSDLSALSGLNQVEELYLHSKDFNQDKMPKTSGMKGLKKLEIHTSTRDRGHWAALDAMLDGSPSIEEIYLTSPPIDSLDRFLPYSALKKLSVKFADKEAGKRAAEAFNKQLPGVEIIIR